MQRNCYYHSQQTLHNFCLNRQCALPLCPKCIHIHLHQNTNLEHHIMPLQDVKQMISEQLSTSIDGLQQAAQDLNDGCSPDSFFKDYSELLDKYRKQAIQKVNRHFDSIEKSLIAEITNKYNLHLASYINPVEEKLREIRQFQRIMKNEREVEVMINMVHNDIISDVEILLDSLQNKKKLLAKHLPRLGYNSNDELEIIPIEIRQQLQLNQSVFKLENRALNSHTKSIDRIIQLQNRLFTLRTRK